jgi:hypothetical protein
MAVKKAVPAKKAPVAVKKAVKKSPVKGQALECEVCGLAVTVDEDCGCVETCDIICCGQPMKEKKPRAKAKAKAA